MSPFSAPLDKLHVVNVGENRDSSRCHLDAVNGNLVYLCKVAAGDVAEQAPLQFFGLGLVRAVDEHTGQIYLVTGMQKSSLKEVNCLALTHIPVPMPLLLAQSVSVAGAGASSVPYVCQAGAQSVLFRNVIDRPFRTEGAARR